MSLRTTLLLWIGLSLLASLLVAGLLVYRHAVGKVDIEMRAAIAVGEHTTENAARDIEDAQAARRQLRLLVTDLNGDRHLRATLMNREGSVLGRSMPLAPRDPAPAWFYGLIAYRPETKRIPVPAAFGGGEVVLQTDPHNEISEAWEDTQLILTVLALSCALNAALVFWAAGRALQPLNAMVCSFEEIGGRAYVSSLRERGPSELKRLARGFNHMVERLADTERREQRLEEQLEQVQEEERMELAQDLHDDVGPLLFAVSVDVAAFQQHASLRSDPVLCARLDATQDAVHRMQQHVKSILGRLRPPSVEDLGLTHSIDGLVGFWKARYPAVSFQVKTPHGPLPAELESQLYRVVRESISNALRHGSPGTIEVDIRVSGREAVVGIRDDGTGLPESSEGGGLGLLGMRERVVSFGGTLTVAAGADGRGVSVLASFPLLEYPA